MLCGRAAEEYHHYLGYIPEHYLDRIPAKVNGVTLHANYLSGIIGGGRVGVFVKPARPRWHGRRQRSGFGPSTLVSIGAEPTTPIGSRQGMAEHIDGPLYYERMGRTGPVMAFVHPNPMDQSCWIFQMAHMSTWFRCIAIDIPGYGRSPKAHATA